MKPFNFLLVGHVDPLALLPPGMAPDAVPVAPFTTDPGRFLELEWRSKGDGRPVRVTTKAGGEPGKVRLKTYRDVVLDYRLHPESKSGDSRGGPGLRSSVGLLPRLTVLVDGVPRHIGKESNRLEEEEEGSLTGSDSTYLEYRDERAE